jgi:prepilin-type N-terminal cleavage/methylation domain-containing protein
MNIPPRSEPRRVIGFTLVEVLTVIAIIGLIAALLMPLVNKAREEARRANCSGRLRQIGLSIAIFASENSQKVPYATNAWARSNTSFAMLSNYLSRSPSVFVCPSDSRRPSRPVTNFAAFATITNACSYSLGRNMTWQSGFQDSMIALDRVGTSTNSFDLLTPTNGIAGATWAKGNHIGAGSILFGDGRVQLLPALPADLKNGSRMWSQTTYLPNVGVISTYNTNFVNVQNPL